MDEKLPAFLELEAAIQVGPVIFTATGREFRLAICEGRLNRPCVLSSQRPDETVEIKLRLDA
jgi:hypothetical protein